MVVPLFDAERHEAYGEAQQTDAHGNSDGELKKEREGVPRPLVKRAHLPLSRLAARVALLLRVYVESILPCWKTPHECGT